MNPIAMFETFNSQYIFQLLKFMKTGLCSSATNMLRDLYTILEERMNIVIQTREIYNAKIRIILLVVDFRRNGSIENG